MNDKTSVEAGFFMFWIATVLLCRHVVVLHENVEQFGKAALERYLGKVYVVLRVILDPCDQGWCGHRLRQYCLCIRKDVFTSQVTRCLPVPLPATALVEQWLQHFIGFLTYRVADWDCHDLFCMEAATVVEAEQSWAQERKKVKECRWAASNPHRFLTENESAYAQAYANMYGSDVICDLGQNPAHRRLNSTISTCGRSVLHTLIKGSGILWCEAQGRWLWASEMFMSMGFPITDEQVNAYAGTESAFILAVVPIAGRSRASAISQCGNAMHVNSISAMTSSLLLLLPELGRAEQMDFAKAWRARKTLKRGRSIS